MNVTLEPNSPTTRTRRFTWVLGTALLLPFLLSACTEPSAPDPDPDYNARIIALEADMDELEARTQMLMGKEEIRSTLLAFAAVVDSADPVELAKLAPKLAADFSMDVVDFDGGEFQFQGIQGLVEGFGPIMVAAQANLAPSAIAVEIDGGSARAYFKFINSVRPPAELGIDVDEKVLLFAANTATFTREQGVWKLKSIELIHSLAYPGTIEALGD